MNSELTINKNGKLDLSFCGWLNALARLELCGWQCMGTTCRNGKAYLVKQRRDFVSGLMQRKEILLPDKYYST